jgi:hypothetical protein
MLLQFKAWLMILSKGVKVTLGFRQLVSQPFCYWRLIRGRKFTGSGVARVVVETRLVSSAG